MRDGREALGTRYLILATLLALAPLTAFAQDKPPLTPTRDVDVVYMMVQADAPGGPRVVEERMRWGIALGKLRIDPPTPGMWVVMDTRSRHVATVRVAEHSVLELDSTQAMLPTTPAAGASFQRGSDDSVAGLHCTEWLTRDVTGTPTLACITADGVLLRARAAGQVLLEALHVAYVAQDPAVFHIPDDYQRITPPPVKRPAP